MEPWLRKVVGTFRGEKKLAKPSQLCILIAHPNISSTQATSDASALTLVGSNTAVRSRELRVSASGLSKEPGDGPDAQPERRSHLHRKPIYHPSRGIGSFLLVVYQREECLHFRYWRSCGFRGLSSPPGGDHNLRADCPVRLWFGHAGRHNQRPLSGPLIDHDRFSLPVLAGSFPIWRTYQAQLGERGEMLLVLPMSAIVVHPPRWSNLMLKALGEPHTHETQ